MPEATPAYTENPVNGDTTTGSTPLELLKAVKEVQERRISVWREYDDAFDTFLNPSASSSSSSSNPNGPVNGSLNNASHDSHHASNSHSSPSANPNRNIDDSPDAEQEQSAGQRCAGCSTSTIPFSEDLLAQILQITTQALIECGHRLRSIQTELSHTTSPGLATLVDQIQSKENALLRSVVHRDQLRKITLKPSSATTTTTSAAAAAETVSENAERDEEAAKQEIAQLDAKVTQIRADIAELMQDVYAESLELQLAEE